MLEKPKTSYKTRFFICTKNVHFLTDQRVASRLGFSRSGCTEPWTGKSTWHEEVFTVVQTSARLAIHYWVRLISIEKLALSLIGRNCRRPLGSCQTFSA